MKNDLLSKCVWAIVAFVFLSLGICNELPAQDWSIKQLKNIDHPILETKGKQFDFRDEVLGHVVAELETDFIDDQLHLNISARSPRIGGYRSYRHVHGSNRLTARVLRTMVDGVSLIELHDQTGRLIPATLKPTEEKLPERRLNLDGSMNYLAMTQEDFIVQLEVVSEVLPKGSYQIDLFLQNQLRLQIKFQVNDNLEAVAFHSAVYLVSQPQSQTQQAETPRAKLGKPADWHERDFEGKYFLISQAIKRDVKELPAWVDFLFEQKEYRLLEQIVLTQPGGFDCNKIGPRLVKASAPNWPRLTRWASIHCREHTNVSASKVIEQNNDTYCSWCVKNQIELHAETKFNKKDVSQYWSKLDAKDVFAALKSPAEVAKFSGKKAEKGKFYLQQFERAILTVVNWKGTIEKRSERFLQLLKHPNDELRQQVLLAYTHLYPVEVPFLQLLEIANDQSEADRVRELAVLAASYGETYKVCDDINVIAAQADHPGWKAAVSRLGDIGSGYDLQTLTEQKPKDQEQQKILQRSTKLIVDREAAVAKSWQANQNVKDNNHAYARVGDVRSKLFRLMEARTQKKASVDSLHRWTVEYFKEVAELDVVRYTVEQITSQHKKGSFAENFRACSQEVLRDMAK